MVTESGSMRRSSGPSSTIVPSSRALRTRSQASLEKHSAGGFEMPVMIIVLVVLAVIVVWVVGMYNSLVRAKNEVGNAWSQIDVQLNRRHDLIPNLVETVKGYMTHERETL